MNRLLALPHYWLRVASGWPIRLACGHWNNLSIDINDLGRLPKA
jgi:hypothetical protein